VTATWKQLRLDEDVPVVPAAREPWLTKRELARWLRCSTRTIERLRLPALRVGGQNRYRPSEVEAHLRARDPRVADVLGLPSGETGEPAT
jgi:excisionase family DNA binding protein